MGPPAVHAVILPALACMPGRLPTHRKAPASPVPGQGEGRRRCILPAFSHYHVTFILRLYFTIVHIVHGDNDPVSLSSQNIVFLSA